MTTTEPHEYLSTSCLHGLHEYCNSPKGDNGTTTWDKRPARCKFCEAECTCTCHQHAAKPAPAAAEDLYTYSTEMAAWLRSILTSHYPTGEDRVAKELIVGQWEDFARLYRAPGTPDAVVAAYVQWTRALTYLAEAEREQGRKGWKPEWQEVYEHFLPGGDPVFGPCGPAGAPTP